MDQLDVRLLVHGFHRHMLWPNPTPVIVVKLPGFFTGPHKVFEVVIGDCPVATAPNESISRRQKRINK